MYVSAGSVQNTLPESGGSQRRENKRWPCQPGRAGTHLPLPTLSLHPITDATSPFLFAKSSIFYSSCNTPLRSQLLSVNVVE
ncbi:hypothetical protein BHM03_00024762 [Ensete ventricosum]|nr:hypothetical protein BHM03_00024762 [Ensete ventricosum]